MVNAVTMNDYQRIKNKLFTIVFFQSKKRTLTISGASIIRVIKEIQANTRKNPDTTTYVFDDEDVTRKGIDTTHRDQKYFQQFL